MAKQSLKFKPIPSNMAIDLYERLLSARQIQLQPALTKAVQEVGVRIIDAELQHLVSEPALNHLAGLGLRGERLFPVPSIIKQAPGLIGYYRMLLGISGKEFSQNAKLGYGPWYTAEQRGKLSKNLEDSHLLEQFCQALINPLEEIVYTIDQFTDRDLSDLTLLTLGSTLQGARNNVIGSGATRGIFDSLKLLISSWIISGTESDIKFETPSGRKFQVMIRPDPDISITELLKDGAVPFIAIEIKGGADASNAHNRAGEAEKSQIKAQQKGYKHRWTIIRMNDVNRQTILNETPTSTELFETREILDQIEQPNSDWVRFRENLFLLLGEKS